MTTWNARTVAEAKDLLRAVQDRVDSSMRAAYPGRDVIERMEPARTTPFHLQITFDAGELDRVADERSTFDNQIHGDDTHH
ncbi:hypothetical protein AB0933_32270 [Streptomyces venezuelae]|uniref:hypothetical protein n=1 Tax=Streptomyces venezuelae TaxID=54571 RepID=UPI0034549C68